MARESFRFRIVSQGSPSSDGSRQPILEAVDVSRRFGGVHAVEKMSLELGRGEMIGLIGPNGAGKTTFFNLLAGSLKPNDGAIRIGVHDVSHEGPEKRILRGVGRTFQIPRPFSEMTVLENVLTGAQGQAGERSWMNFLRPGHVAKQERAAVDKARALLDFVTLSHLEREPARVLSGGQRKLLELARVLMADPRRSCSTSRRRASIRRCLELIIERVQKLNAQGKAILLIEHNMDMVSRLCRRVVVMAGGRQLAEGAPGEVARSPAVIEAYLGGAA